MNTTNLDHLIGLAKVVKVLTELLKGGKGKDETPENKCRDGAIVPEGGCYGCSDGHLCA